jgi:hypothetical protein
MGARALRFFVAVALSGLAVPCLAQVPTGTISGHVVSADGKALPGVTVSVVGTSLQGTRTAVTSESGDYLLPLLPPGDYTVSFEIGDFQTIKQTRSLAGTETALIDARMSIAPVTDTVTVVGSAKPFVETAQVATNFKQELMASLPSNRTLDAVLLLAPAVHATGPRGAFTISGSQSYENLFTLNGTVITENLRGSPFTLYVEDALQETTVATSGVSAEYGRFEGGVANVITKSGGNTPSGSFRDSFANDKWRSFTPFETAQLAADPTKRLKTDKVVPTYEATFGGPVMKDRLWFFGATRSQQQESTRTTANTLIPYVRTNDDQRYEGKLTYSVKNHTLQASGIKLNQVLKNNTGSTVMDLKSLTNQRQPQSLWSFHYTGILSPNFFVEAQYSARHLTFGDVGANTRDRIDGTLILDLSRSSARFWSPTFCSGSVCDGDEQRNNSDVVLKGSYFLSGKWQGSHHLVFGYDSFDDNIWANTHASGSDYRIRATGSILMPNGDIYPQFIPGTTSTSTQIEYDPIVEMSKGSHLRTHSSFINDNWRWNSHFSFGLGLRLDKNAARDGSGQNVGDKASLSPRLSAIWDPKADGKWAVTGSYARYVMALTSNLAGSTTKAGNSATFRWFYQGPPINPTGSDTLVSTPDALRQIFNWFDANGGTSMTPALANIPGVNMKMLKPLTSPYSHEFSGGVSRALGNKGTLRVDGTYREYKNFYSLRTDTTTGTVTDDFQQKFDLSVVENTDAVHRRYAGMVTQASYAVGSRLTLGGNYTLSHAYGNLEGETVNAGPSGASLLSYPEYKRESWNAPEGDLLIDQRHRARLWATYVPPMAGSGTLTLGVLQQMASGTPYGALAQVNTRNFVTNPGYQTPPPAVDYYFTARDAFHTQAQYRTDLSVNYNYRVAHVGSVHPELFFHGEVLNLFNRFQLCGCGGTVFNNGGITDLTTINQTVRVITTAPFDPFNATPVEGVNWAKDPAFGTAVNALAYTSPRIFRFSVGVKF